MKVELATQMDESDVITHELIARVIIAYIDLYIMASAYDNYFRKKFRIPLSDLNSPAMYSVGISNLRSKSVQQLLREKLLAEGWQSVEFYTELNPPTVVLKSV